MVFIQGEDFEISTFRVIDYLNLNKADYVKINRQDVLDNVDIEITGGEINVIMDCGEKKIQTKEISSYWYRRGEIILKDNFQKKHVENISETSINRFLVAENISIINFINHVLEKTQLKIGAFTKSQLEKLEQLMEAKACGLDIPESYVYSEKKKLLPLVRKHGKIASKGIKNSFSTKGEDDLWYFMTTSVIDENNIADIPNTFSPTLFQVYLKKKYEIRIFFFHNNFYPMAIFSQSNPKTKVDFRNYDRLNPNRTVPLTLPNEVITKLKAVMVKLGIDTGSIDMILTTDNRHVFLEVNPDGQFGMVSLPCNYFIERHIANILSHK